MEGEEFIEKTLEEMERSAQELLEWSQAHPGSTLWELEEKVQAWKRRAAARVLEAAVALQGERGKGQGDPSSSGGTEREAGHQHGWHDGLGRGPIFPRKGG